MSGFVYIWFDRKKKRFYVGSHWGSEDDRYVCSSKWMKRSYKRRPQDFRREILSRVTSSKKDLLEEEQRWLNMIKPKELGKKYYNLKRNAGRTWHALPEEERQRIAKKLQKPRNVSEAMLKACRENAKKAQAKSCETRRDKSLSPEHKKKVSQGNLNGKRWGGRMPSLEVLEEAWHKAGNFHAMGKLLGIHSYTAERWLNRSRLENNSKKSF